MIELTDISTYFDGYYIREATARDAVDYTVFCLHLGIQSENSTPSVIQSICISVAASLVDSNNIRKVNINNLEEFLAQPHSDIVKAHKIWRELNQGMLILG